MVYNKILFLAGLLIISTSTAQATPQYNMNFLDKSAKVMEQASHKAKGMAFQPPKTTKAQQKEFHDILIRSGKQVKSSLASAAEKEGYKAKKKMRNREIVIAVTLSSKFDIKGALTFLKSYSDDKQVRLAIAGLPKGCKTFRCAVGKFHELGIGTKFPPVTIDPKLFKDRGINLAPTMIYTDKDGVEIARVEGLWNPKWIRDQVANGIHGDLGVKGPVVQIEERNMMDEIASRLNKIDVKKKIKNAKASYWKNKKYVDLPPSDKDSQFMFEPIVTATADIKDAKGNVIVAKGTTVNSLTKMPFTRSVIVYNPNRKGERELALRLRNGALRRGKQPVMIITRPDESSFNSVFDEQQKIGSRVFLLNQAMATRFQITHTVSVVEAQDQHFVVKEFGNASR